MNDLFIKNIALWTEQEPKSAFKLQFGHVNDQTYVNEEKSKSELDQWAKNLPTNETEVLYVFGIGSYEYKLIQNWLTKDPKRKVVFLEDKLVVIHHFFETETATDLLTDSQAFLLYFENLDDPLLENLYWKFLTSKVFITPSLLYGKERSKFFETLSHKVVYELTLRQAMLDEYLNHGVAYYRNFYPNIRRLPGSSLADGLAGAFSNVPAIICGAGPSLNKHFSLLKNLQNRALIFAGGSSIIALNNVGILPHLGAGLDPNPEQFKRLKENSSFEVPFLYRTRMDHKAFLTIHGPRFYVSGSGGFNTARWFENKLGIQGVEIEEGYNVINFCLDVARVWGCNPIIFVGMDLAFTDLQAYAAGVLTDAKVNQEALLNAPELDDRALLKSDIYGKPIYTLWKWIAESQWVSTFAKEHPEIQLINASEGGLGFESVPNDTFQNVINKYLTTEFELHGRLHGEMQNHYLQQVTSADVETLLDVLKASLERCAEHLQILIEDLQTQKPQSGLAALAETELMEEEAFQAILEAFDNAYSKVIENVSQRKLLEIPLKAKKLQFLKDVVHTHLKLLGNG